MNQILGTRRTGGELVAGIRDSSISAFDSLDVSEHFLTLEKAADQRLDPAPAGELQRVSDLTKLRPLQLA